MLQPVPGDEIVGFVTRGRGVSIHRTDCINIMNLSELEKVRLIDAEWQQGAEQGDNGLYLAEIKIFGNNRTGLLVDITRIFTERESISVPLIPRPVNRVLRPFLFPLIPKAKRN